MSYRRLSLQLTPLLDLLLIVIFAQHMEVLQGARSADAEIQAERSAIETEKQRMVAVFEERKTQLEATHSDQKSANDRLREEYDNRFQSILNQHQQAASAMAAALNLPGELLEQVAKLRSENNPADAQRLEEASQRIAELLKSRGNEFLQLVVRYDEMQKHVSIWEIHLQDNGQALFTDGQQTHTISFETTDELSMRIYEASKTLTEPKILVLLLLTYGDAQAGHRRRATDTMPELVEKLRRDAGSTHWYDFALMGYRPAGPIFRNNAAATP